MRKQQNDLSNALFEAIGAQTRFYIAKVVDVDLALNTQRVTAYSEEIGNFEVVVGNNQFINKDDWIFVARTMSKSKYTPYMFVGYASAEVHDLGTPLIWNQAGTVANASLLPTRAKGARIGEIRVVGASSYYIFTEDGTWEPFGGSGAVDRSFGFGWASKITAPFTLPAPMITMDVDSRLRAMDGIMFRQPASSKRFSVEIEYLNESGSWNTIFNPADFPGNHHGMWFTNGDQKGSQSSWSFLANPPQVMNGVTIPLDGLLVIKAGWVLRMSIAKANEDDSENAIDCEGITVQLHLTRV